MEYHEQKVTLHAHVKQSFYSFDDT